jgi:hypothetical protein
MRRCRGNATLLAGALVLAGCSVDTPSPAPAESATTNAQPGTTRASDAHRMCALALGTARVASAGPVTTIGEIRSTRVGPGFAPAEDAFPEMPATAPASYCWAGEDGVFWSFGVTDDGQKIQLTGIHGIGSAPTGRPVTP